MIDPFEEGKRQEQANIEARRVTQEEEEKMIRQLFWRIFWKTLFVSNLTLDLTGTKLQVTIGRHSWSKKQQSVHRYLFSYSTERQEYRVDGLGIDEHTGDLHKMLYTVGMLVARAKEL